LNRDVLLNLPSRKKDAQVNKALEMVRSIERQIAHKPQKVDGHTETKHPPPSANLSDL
jgi:hypothetical protein